MSNEEKPACFNQYVQGQEAAERDCFHCKEMRTCAANSVADGPVQKQFAKPAGKFKKDAGFILDEMADTFRQRNAVYGDNYKMVGKLMAVLFPNGVPKEVLHSDQFHLFELKLVKLSRFAISNLTHQDSIHDDGVYSAMIEAIVIEQQGEQA